MPSRHDAIAGFYAAKATELERGVRHAITGPHTLIEDACSAAWLQLLRNPQVTLDPHGFRWLYVVAIREAYRLSDKTRREPPLGSPRDLSGDLSLAAPDTWQLVERRLTRQERLALVRQIPPRRRELVFLHAAGFSYLEIAELTGNTLRTVERQLLRGKRALRRLAATAATDRNGCP